ncbi:transposase [Mesorhizobium sp. M0976]|uniref:transposase n=1 Tax=Mesorhizobium sp. M0976 TaxID=2957038 RepID=UPI00333AB0B1
MAARLASIRTPEGTPLPDNTRAELCRFLERLQLVREQIRAIEQVRLRRLAAAPAAAASGPHAMVRLLARIIGIGVETADMLVHEILSRGLRDRRAVARYAGLTGSPDESGKRRREKGLARAGNARVRRGMIQLAWSFLLFQKDSAWVQWFRARNLGTIENAQEFMLAAMQPGKKPVEHDVAGSSFEQALEAGAQGRRAARTRSTLVVLELVIEPPDQLAHDVDGLTLIRGHGYQFVDEPLGVDPAQRSPMRNWPTSSDTMTVSARKPRWRIAPTSPLRWRS